MSQIVMHVHLNPRAQADFNEKKSAIMTQRRLGLIDTAKAKFDLDKLYREFYTTENLEQADPDRSVGATCPRCKRLHIMVASVERFRCECYPHIQHSVVENLTVDSGVRVPKVERSVDIAQSA